MSILQKETYRFNVIPIHILGTFITKPEKNPKIHMKTQKTMDMQRNAKQNAVG